jgi:hypothetical protein
MIQTRPMMPSAIGTSPRKFHVPGLLDSHPSRRESCEIAHGATPWASGTPRAHTTMKAVRRDTVRLRASFEVTAGRSAKTGCSPI